MRDFEQSWESYGVRSRGLLRAHELSNDHSGHDILGTTLWFDLVVDLL